jgi:hypothetical protein
MGEASEENVMESITRLAEPRADLTPSEADLYKLLTDNGYRVPRNGWLRGDDAHGSEGDSMRTVRLMRYIPLNVAAVVLIPVAFIVILSLGSSSE